MMSTLQATNLKHGSSASNNLVLDANGNVTAAGTVAMATPFAMRNKIINGAMDISQRGTSFPAIASLAYSVDRWLFAKTGAGVLTASQETDVPSGQGFVDSLRLTVTTADTSIAASDLCNIQQRIEGYNVTDLIGKTFTLSFWVRSSKTGTHCVAFKNAGTAGSSDRSYVLEYTVNAANTWEFKTVTVVGGLTTAGTWDYTNGIGLTVLFSLAVGSNFQTTAGAWQTGSFNGTANQVNCLDTIGNIFALTGVQLEVGSVATPFERRLYGTELQLAQRYFQWVPFSMGFQSNGANHFLQMQVPFQVQMRTVPSFAIISADPNSTQVTNNNLLNTFNATYSSVNYGFASLTASVAANCQVLGYRSAASAEL